MVAVTMRRHNLDLQEAIDFVGGLCDASIDRFEHERQSLPSWGRAIDGAVATYVQGLQDWMIGALHWSYDTARYFGDEGMTIKSSRVVALLPKQRRGRGLLWSPHTSGVTSKRESSASVSRCSLRHRLTCRDDAYFVQDLDAFTCSAHVV